MKASPGPSSRAPRGRRQLWKPPAVRWRLGSPPLDVERGKQSGKETGALSCTAAADTVVSEDRERGGHLQRAFIRWVKQERGL